MSNFGKKPGCDDIAPLFVFYVCDELEQKERVAVEQHIAVCEGCRAQLAEELNFSEAVSGVPQDADEFDRTHEPEDIALLIDSSIKNPNHIIFAQRVKRSENFLFKLGYIVYRTVYRVLTGASISARPSLPVSTPPVCSCWPRTSRGCRSG